MLGQSLGYFHIGDFQEPIEDVVAFLEKRQTHWIIPVSVPGYFVYIALMGLTLSLGAIRSLIGKRLGLPLIGAFLVLYAALFINFQTINQKIVHLAVCAVLFLVLCWSKKRPA